MDTRQKNKGIALLLVLIVIMVLSLLGTAYLGSILSESGIARNQENSEKAFFIAEAGINRGLKQIMDYPDISLLPWMVTENMTAGHYTVTAAEAPDVGEGYVRITSTGYVDNVSRISEIVVFMNAWTHALMSNTDITYSETSSGYVNGDVHANGSVAGIAATSGLDYVAGSRDARGDDARFEIKNNTGFDVTLTALTATWTYPTAYYETINMDVNPGTNYGNVWRYQQAGNVRAGSGDKSVFNQGKTVIVPANSIVVVDILNFRTNQTGGGGAQQNMDNTRFTITAWAGSIFYTASVPLEGEGAEVVITGKITQGALGDPLIKMPLVVPERYYEDRTFYYDGDYVFNGIEGQASSYRDEGFYVTGKVILDNSFTNMTFNYCSIFAEGGIEIGPQRNGTFDYVIDSTVGRQKDIAFQMKNESGQSLSVSSVSFTWDGDNNNRYQSIDAAVSGGTDYGTVWNGNASKNTIVNFSPAIVVPVAATVNFTVHFSRNTAYSFLSRFFASSIEYASAIVEEGRLPNLVFQGRREYAALSTQEGDILEYGTKDKGDMQMQGIIYSQEGTVEFNNITLDGAIVANRINLIKDFDIEYKSRYVPNPPPEYIAGLSILDWQEKF
ncbi:MAG: pilus assembly PilX N-terminal domain-containing protein [Candidatus Omnitrophota bacterium]